jgi:hypothetical protein
MIANPRHPAIAAPMNMHVNGISRINWHIALRVNEPPACQPITK